MYDFLNLQFQAPYRLNNLEIWFELYKVELWNWCNKGLTLKTTVRHQLDNFARKLKKILSKCIKFNHLNSVSNHVLKNHSEWEESCSHFVHFKPTSSFFYSYLHVSSHYANWIILLLETFFAQNLNFNDLLFAFSFSTHF